MLPEEDGRQGAGDFGKGEDECEFLQTEFRNKKERFIDFPIP